MLRYGFKAQCERLVSELRRELGVGVHGPLDPLHLAAHLDVPVEPLSSLRPRVRAAVDHVLHGDRSVLSGLTIFPDWPARRRVVLYNDGNSVARQASDITHELAHGLLLHEPRQAVVRGCRNYQRDEEDEAAWLSGALLIPAPAAVRIARRGLSEQEAGDEYGVSPDMVRWRLNVTAARRRAG